MFKKLSIFGATLISCNVLAYADMPFATNAATPVQVFEQAGQAEHAPAQSQVKAAFADPLHAEQGQSSGSTPNKAQVPATKPETTPTQLTPAEKVALQDQMDTLNRTTVIYRQSADQRIADLKRQVVELQARLGKLSQAMLLLNQEVSQINNRQFNSASVPLTPSAKKNSVRSLKSQLGDVGFYVLLSLILVAIFWILYSLLVKPKHKARQSNASGKEIAMTQADYSADDTQDEYDYMGSNESIPAKLNLARAYIAMDDLSSAKKIIQEVLSMGSESQRHEAGELMEKITQAQA